MPVPGHPVLVGRETADEPSDAAATTHISGSDALADVLALLPIDAEAWRLCDRRQREDDAAFVVAYIERVDRTDPIGGADRTGHVLDVIWMTGVPRRGRFTSVEAIRDEACRRLRAEATSASTRPVPIPHFPPPQV